MEKGDKGDTEPKGEQGDTGEKGDTGPQGAKGEKGDNGETPVITVVEDTLLTSRNNFFAICCFIINCSQITNQVKCHICINLQFIFKFGCRRLIF